MLLRQGLNNCESLSSRQPDHQRLWPLSLPHQCSGSMSHRFGMSNVPRPNHIVLPRTARSQNAEVGERTSWLVSSEGGSVVLQIFPQVVGERVFVRHIGVEDAGELWPFRREF